MAGRERPYQDDIIDYGVPTREKPGGQKEAPVGIIAPEGTTAPEGAGEESSDIEYLEDL